MKKKLSLTTRIFIGLITGVILGLLINYFLPSGQFRDDYLVNGLFKVIGQMFLRSIMMLIVPLVFVSIVNGVIGMGDVKKLGRIGGKTIFFYMVTTAVAIVIALVLAHVLSPAGGANLSNIEVVEVNEVEAVSMVDTLIEIIPKNAIEAFAKGSMLQVIVFGLVMGIGIMLIGDKASRLREIFEELNDVMIRLVLVVMKLAPIGVTALIAQTFANMGIQVLIPLIKYVAVVYIGFIIHVLVVYFPILKIFGKASPKIFFKKYVKIISFAFSTASSGATLPLNMEVVEEEMGASADIASFTLPLGATINMDGTAIMQGVAIIFIAQVYNLDLTTAQLIKVALTTVLASIGTAGVPGAGTMMLAMIMSSIGLPIEGMGLILGVDRLTDMGRTAINVTGDAVCTIVMAKSENALDMNIYNDMSTMK